MTLRTTYNSLPDDSKKAIIAMLKTATANSQTLYSQAKTAHWNVRGGNFIALHELFDDVAKAVQAITDDLAERSLQLGGHIDGDLRNAAKLTTLPTYPAIDNSGKSSAKQHVTALATSLAAFGTLTREHVDVAEDAGDPVTADLLTEITSEADKFLWFVESHLAE